MRTKRMGLPLALVLVAGLVGCNAIFGVQDLGYTPDGGGGTGGSAGSDSGPGGASGTGGTGATAGAGGASGAAGAPGCQKGQGDCDGNKANGCETDLETSTMNCGSCGHACTNSNGTTSCVNGACNPVCATGYEDCDGNKANGCEADLQTSTSNCGSCGHACTNANGTTSCVNGACNPVCATGYKDCDGNKTNGCEADLNTSVKNCGACGQACGGKCTGGRCLVTLASGQNQPTRMAVDANNVYWTNLYGHTVMQVAVGGGTPVTVASQQNSPDGIAVNGTNVYWTTYVYPGGSVLGVPIGGGTQAAIATGQGFPNAVTADQSYVYWTITGGVEKAPLNGSTVATLSTESSNKNDIALEGTEVYWTNGDGNTLMEVPTGGGNAVTLASNQDDPDEIAVDAKYVYWTNTGAALGTPAVMKIDHTTSGAQPVPLVSSGLQYPVGIAVDGNTVYFTDSVAGTVMKVSNSGGTAVTLASGQISPADIAVQGTSVYWIDSGGSVMKLTPK